MFGERVGKGEVVHDTYKVTQLECVVPLIVLGQDWSKQIEILAMGTDF